MLRLIIVFLLVCRSLIVKVRYGIWDRFSFFRDLKKRMIHGRQEKKCLKDKMIKLIIVFFLVCRSLIVKVRYEIGSVFRDLK